MTKSLKLLLHSGILFLFTSYFVNAQFAVAASNNNQINKIKQLIAPGRTRSTSKASRLLQKSCKGSPKISITRPHIVLANHNYTIRVRLSCTSPRTTKVQLVTQNASVLPVPTPNGDLNIGPWSLEGSVTLKAGNPTQTMEIKLYAFLIDYGKRAEKTIIVEK
jgi:hypothetical protein